VPDPGPPSPRHFQDVLERLAHLLETRGVAYMLVGAVAVGVWGRPRATADIDVTVLVDEAGLDALARATEPLGFSIDEQWQEWNPLLRGSHVRVTTAGAAVDIMRPRDPHEVRAIERRQRVTIDDGRLWFAAPDDLILMKLKAGRPRDFEDAVGVLVAQRALVDEAYMVAWAGRLGVADELAFVLRESGPP
jgi:hypothetical protein